MNLPRLCLRELRHTPKFALLFMLNSALGLLGLMAVINLRTSFNSVLDARSRQLLGADLLIFARQGISAAELTKASAIIPGTAELSRGYSLFSMAAGNENSRLVSVQAIEKNFPFYGAFEFADGTRYPYPETAFLEADEVWIYPELAMMLNLQQGAELKIGNAAFRVARLIEVDSLQAFQEGAMAPRVYLSMAGLERAGILGASSTFREKMYYRLPATTVADTDRLVEMINLELTDPAVRVRGPRENSERVGRSLNYLNDFLGLVALVALFLSSVGMYYLYRSYLHQRRGDMAILATLGLNRVQLFRLYFYHLLFLGLGSVFIAWSIALVLFPLIGWLSSRLLPFPLPVFAGWQPFLVALGVGTGGNLCLALPLLSPTLNLRALEILQSFETRDRRKRWRQAVLFLPWLIFYWLLSLIMSKSIIVGTAFTGVFVLAAALVLPPGLLVLNKLARVNLKFSLETRLSLKNLAQFKLGTLSLFMALVLGTMLLTMVPTLEHNLRDEIQRPDSARLPSLFLFDIQEEQLELLTAAVATGKVELRGLSPMIQGRLTSINGQPFMRDSNRPRTREEEQEFRIRNRGVNLTYRAQLDESELLLRGRGFSGSYDFGAGGPAEITVENRYARRVGLELGDIVGFDILDMPVEGRIVGIREVRWTSFMPNFFIVFQPGMLEDAPKTYLAVIPALARADKQRLQQELVSTLPNISMIDIAQLIERIVLILEQMGLALRSMAWLSVAVGFFVLFSLVQHQMQMRERDLTLLKALGLPLPALRRMIRREFFMLSLSASLCGGVLSTGVSFLFAHLFFDGLWSFTPYPLLSSTVCVTLLAVIVAEVAARRSLGRSPSELLQESL